MNKKTVYIVVAVIAVILVVGVAGIVLLNNGNGGTNPTPTPEEPSVIPVSDATSLQFKVDTVTEGTTSTTNYFAKDLDKSEKQLRVEIVIPDIGNIVYVVNGANHTAWTNESGEWAEADFDTNWENWYTNAFAEYVDNLAHWTDGDYTSEDGNTTIYQIVVNPTLEDSLFEMPTTEA